MNSANKMVKSENPTEARLVLSLLIDAFVPLHHRNKQGLVVTFKADPPGITMGSWPDLAVGCLDKVVCSSRPCRSPEVWPSFGLDHRGDIGLVGCKLM